MTSASRRPTNERGTRGKGDERGGCGRGVVGAAAHDSTPPRHAVQPESLVPDLLPPRRRTAIVIRTPTPAHLPAYGGQVPPGEIRQGFRFLDAALAYRLPVLPVRLAARVALPGVTQHVPRLEIALVRRLLEDEIFREVPRVVADVEPRDEGVLRAPGDEPLRTRRAEPEHAQAAQFVRRQGIGRAGIAPAHVPGVLEEHRLAVLVLHLARE